MYHDDNFGNYDMGDNWEDREDSMQFYKYNQSRSVWKTCSMCGREVKLLPQYDKCNSCCERLEGGWQY